MTYETTKKGALIGWAQLGAILLQFAGFIWAGGRWSGEMQSATDRVRELQSIVSELTKAQAQAAVAGASQTERVGIVQKRLDEITARIDRLEIATQRNRSEIR